MQHTHARHPRFVTISAPTDNWGVSDPLAEMGGDDAAADFPHPTPGLDVETDDNVHAVFIGPGDSLFRNYHLGLTGQPCNANGDFLLNGTQPEPRQPKPLDDWSPYNSHLEFELADFIYTHNQMSAANLNILLELWAASLVEAGASPIFSSYKEMYRTIDKTEVGDVEWQSFTVKYTGGVEGDPMPWMHDEYDIWFRDPHKVVQNMLANPEFSKGMDYRPFREYDTKCSTQRWQNFMSGDWAWHQADIIAQDPDCLGSMFVPIILGSDKTTVSVATGQNDYYPLYLSVGNIHNNTFKPGMAKPEVMLFGDDHYRRVIYGLGPYIADYEEQALLTTLARCLAYHNNLDNDNALHRCHDHAELLIAEFALDALWNEYGIVGELVPFTNDFLRADIYELIAPDLLHQIIKGAFKDHLVEWVEKYLCHTHGDAHANEILDDIDRHIAAVAPFTSSTACHETLQATYPVVWGTEWSLFVDHRVKACEGCQEAVPAHQQVDFESWGMLEGTCLLTVLDQLASHNATRMRPIEANQWLSDEDKDELEDPLVSASIDESRGDYEDVNGPRVEAHVCLARSRQQNRAATIVALADELHIPNLSELVRAFLVGQLYPDNNHDPTDIPHLECPGYEGRISIHNSASSTFYAPSNLSGVGGMHCEYIRAAPMWRQEGPRYDCAFVITDPELEGMHGMDVARILCFFSFKAGGIFYPCAIVRWFDRLGEAPDELTGMWMVRPSFTSNHQCNLAVIHVDTIFRAAHLIPIYGRDFVPREISPCHSYDAFYGFYVNKFADHHAFEIAY
ncbi:hypothetical protein PISMIDRAFT_12622 [Pisolithus microcarpus 441]|uniref:Uncharacterized protein n=1 Tax=Pisolithus microcarpus 441 TaxID=765257 RepID=A0A0C9ZMJ1_9AGAM|nr:hypothetical protein PISMIDRAFT_12622 [Pisolithus microcarpus 441]